MHSSRPIFESNPTHPSCPAATLVECADGHLLAARFAGTYEGHPDVAIWLARYDGARWSAPLMVANEPGTTLWNPVFLRDHEDTLWLFYKAVQASPPGQVCIASLSLLASADSGATWRPSQASTRTL